MDLARLLLGEMKARQPTFSEERAKIRLRRLVKKISYHQEEREDNAEGAVRASDKVGFKINYDCSFIINFDPSGAQGNPEATLAVLRDAAPDPAGVQPKAEEEIPIAGVRLDGHPLQDGGAKAREEGVLERGINLRLCKDHRHLLWSRHHLLEGQEASPGRSSKVWDSSFPRESQPGGPEAPAGGWR